MHRHSPSVCALSLYEAVAAAIGAKLKKTTVGNPRNETVRMGALVSKEQYDGVLAGIEVLKQEATVLFDGNNADLVDADKAVAACVAPVLLGTQTPATAKILHEVEVFGPVCTLMAYKDIGEAHALIQRGEGSLVMSVYSDNPAFIAQTAAALGSHHGRIHAISPDVAALHTGHGNVMPVSLHGGPGRAGGGEELGGLRALNFYHRRTAVQASTAALDAMAATATKLEM